LLDSRAGGVRRSACGIASLPHAHAGFRQSDLWDDWKSLVEPDLHDSFLGARETVSANLRNADGSLHFTIPRSHIDLWLSTLDQARLALTEIHQFTEADMSRAPGDLDDPREFALMRMGIYGSLQEWLVAVVA
jgi:hypothetical protein